MKKIFSTFFIFTFLFVILLFFSSIASVNHFSHITFINSIVLNSCSFSAALLIFYKLRNLPQVRISRYVLPVSILCMTLTWACIIIGRFDYSVKIVLVGNILVPILLILFNHLISDKNLKSLYVIPSSNKTSFVNSNEYNFFILSKPMPPKKKCDGLVIDFNDFKRSYEWDKFLVQAVFKKIPIYSYVEIKEILTGRVDLNFLEENDVGGLQPSIEVSFVKRIFDVIVVLFLLPIVIPIGLLVSLAIIIDTPGGVFFKQQRVGLEGKNFNLIKFRSMLSKDNKSETKHGDSRITRVGSVIRKFRLDEIPQFINVLLGDMSLIGPRPETLTLVKEYDKKIPFFMYRHIVKPGISGWAQVMLGYTVGLNEKKEKLAYDLYYIKHYSISLEALIFFKTIKIIFTGAGAK